MAKTALSALLDKERLAALSTRFKAWWEGAEAPAMAPAAAAPGGDDDLFAPEPPPANPRLQALALVWGEGRLQPEDAAGEALIPARLELAPEGVLALIGPGLAGPVREIARAHPGGLEVHEWREETRAALTLELAALGRGHVKPLDLETGPLPAEAYQGVWANEAFTYSANSGRLALQIARSLAPGGRALVEDYFTGSPREPLGAAFASAFLEPQLTDAGTLKAALFEAGLKIEAEEDLTDEHAASARAALARLPERLQAHGVQALGAKVLQELAWELESWGDRMRLLQAGALRRGRFTVKAR